MNILPKISIITIVFNDVKHFEGTLLSVLNHRYPNIEYIVIDGASTDGTVDLIKKYAGQISYWSSESDNGIYDAMNKGLRVATGHYIWFLNSGDKIYNETLLADIFSGLNDGLPDVVYGETMIVDEEGNEIGLRRLKAPEVLTWRSLMDGMLVCHQSIFVARGIAPLYNTAFRYAADYDWMLQSLKKAKSIYNSHRIISAFLDGGISKNNIIASLKERFEIMVHNYGFFATLFNHVRIGTKFLYYLIRNKRF